MSIHNSIYYLLATEKEKVDTINPPLGNEKSP